MLITIFDLTPLIFDLHHPSQWKTGNKQKKTGARKPRSSRPFLGTGNGGSSNTWVWVYSTSRDIETLRELTNGRITSRAGAGRPTIPQSSSDSDVSRCSRIAN